MLKAAALKANAIQMGSADNPVVFVGVSAGNPNQVIERGVMDNLVSLVVVKRSVFPFNSSIFLSAIWIISPQTSLQDYIVVLWCSYMQ